MEESRNQGPVDRAEPSPAVTDAILESISDGVFAVDSRWKIASFNRAAEEITGVPREEAIGRVCSDVFRSSMCGPDCSLRETLRTGKPVIGRSGFIVDADGERIPISISTAVWRDASGAIVGGAETFRDLSEVQSLRDELQDRGRFGDLVSRSPAMRPLFDLLPAVAASSSTVLVLGETGTGKELVARTIHANGPRAAGPFVAVNCGALPDNLLESELFGYKAGAFTGAVKDKPGRFALAKGGTLFLDEIGEISPALQVRLLRVLQERRYEPLGSVESESADVRIVAATHRDLAAEVRSGRFREDLYYRVNVVRVELPPLRLRKDDIPLLVEQFVSRFNAQQGKAIEGVSMEAMSFLVAHDWPGNIRELENAIERAFVGCSSGWLGIEQLPEEWRRSRSPGAAVADLRIARDQLDAEAILAALGRNGGNRVAAARELGVHKSTFFRMVKRLGLDLPAKGA